MAATPSTMLALGTPAPDFSLADVTTGRKVCLSDFHDKDVLAVMFICHHCPFVQHVKAELARLGRDYASKNAAIDALLAGKTVNPDQKGSIGCNIKWRKGSEPSYFPKSA
jgi:hypothetical protein